MKSKLTAASEEVIEATNVVSVLREDVVIKRLITAFQAANFAKFDPDALLEELTDIANDAAFDGEGFPLDSSDGIASAAKHRFKLQALRDRLIGINKKLREAMAKVGRTYRLTTVHLRQHETIKSIDSESTRRCGVRCPARDRRCARGHEVGHGFRSRSLCPVLTTRRGRWTLGSRFTSSTSS